MQMNALIHCKFLLDNTPEDDMFFLTMLIYYYKNSTPEHDKYVLSNNINSLFHNSETIVSRMVLHDKYNI